MNRVVTKSSIFLTFMLKFFFWQLKIVFHFSKVNLNKA